VVFDAGQVEKLILVKRLS